MPLQSPRQTPEGKPVHYLVYEKNENAFQKEYEEVFAALTEKDARAYISYEVIDEFTIFKISKVDRNTETEIAIVRLEDLHTDYGEF